MKKIKFLILFILVCFFHISTSFTQDQEKILHQIDRSVIKAVNEWESPGLAIAIVKDDSIIYAKGYGVRELGRSERVDEKTIFAVGSQTKSFTTAALAMLVDEKKLKWDDPVIKYLPDLKLSDPWITQNLTIRDCLTHRTGYDPMDLLWILTDFDRNELLRRYQMYSKPVNKFRYKFQYNNFIFYIAAQVISEITGETWDDFIKERIFRPLHMESSNTSITSFTDKDNVASPHEIIDSKIQVVPWRNVDNIGAVGSINSNVTDMAQWMRFQLGNGIYNSKRLISLKAMKEMHAPQIFSQVWEWLEVPNITFYVTSVPESHYISYGLGWFIQDYKGYKIIHHGGDVDGMRCMAGMIPEMNLGVVILSNLHPATLVEAVMFTVFDAFIGNQTRDWSSEILTAVKKYNVKMEEIRK